MPRKKTTRGRPKAKRTYQRRAVASRQQTAASKQPPAGSWKLEAGSRGPIRRVKGMHDILPKDQKYFELIKFMALKHFRLNGFERIDVPTIEYASLFSKGTGKDTDIVQKEMYYLASNDEEKEPMALRPEATPGIARAYVEHGMLNLPQPMMLYYVAPMFRRENPQKGRMREFWQFGVEVLGTSNPSSDAQVIKMAWDILEDLGLKDLTLEINSLGCRNDQNNMREILISYFEKKKQYLCEDCKRRLTVNPFRILDCKEEKCKRIAEDAPQIIDHLCAHCRNDFKKALEMLDELSIPYDINTRLVRGLDYYSKTVFEITPAKDKSRQGTIIGGGRYDYLIEMYGGREAGAVGWAGGIERLMLALKEQKIEVEDPYKPRVFLAQLGEQAKKKSFSLLNELQKEGIGVRAALSKDSLRSQLRLANKFKVELTLILGQKEVQDKTIIVRDMKEGIQEIVALDKTLEYIKGKLK
ncbi:histidine--tRNA ligase [Patescibacteria group bacterium]|nr:histidine--tRNA ligase [Patescibacteria group bacterium]